MGFRSVGFVGLSVFHLRLTLLGLLVALSLACLAADATVVIIVVAIVVGIATPYRCHYRPLVSLQISCILHFIFLV